MEEIFKKSDNLDVILKEEIFESIDSIINSLIDSELDHSISFKDIKILMNSLNDKKINFILYKSCSDFCVNIIDKDIKIDDFYYSSSYAGSGDVICYRFNEKDTVINYLLIYDEAYEDLNENREEIYRVYRKTGYKLKICKEISIIRAEKSKIAYEKFKKKQNVIKSEAIIDKFNMHGDAKSVKNLNDAL